MLSDFSQIEKTSVMSVEWTGDPTEYDINLHNLGYNHDTFLIVNPYIEDEKLVHFINEVPETEKCVVWKYKDQWVAKLFHKDWNPDLGYSEQMIKKPTYAWRKNPDLDKLMTFDDDPFGTFEPDPWDSCYKLIWYIDPKFNPLPDKVWAITCHPIGKEVKGTKDMGYLSPSVSVEYNDDLPDLGLNLDECYPAFYDLQYECAWELDKVHSPTERMWVVKFTPQYRKSKNWKWYGVVTPQFDITYNSKLKNLNYDIDYVIPWHDLGYEHMWMLDRKHLQNGEADVWAFKIKLAKSTKGSKVVDYISPKFSYEYNPALPKLNYDIDYVIPWHDLGYEHMWMLDRKHLQNGEADIWAVKLSGASNLKGSKAVNYISPTFSYEYNPALPKLNYDIDYVIPWHDLGYEHMWMLDRKHLQNGEDDIWAVKISYSNSIKGTKVISFISPKVNYSYNPELPNLKIKINYSIPWHDLKYKNVWYLDKKYSKSEEKIWVVTAIAADVVEGDKDVGLLNLELDDNLDVIFISYNELNAEENWKRVLEKAPWAKRINGVKGIFEAHQQAARLSTTDMFYVVDGDAWLVDDWNFDYQPSVFDRDCAYVWSSINPLNKLVYGYGGIKLFSKSLMLKSKKMSKLDMTTSVMPKLKIMDKISNETRFNVDEFSTWRSAFRECVKLYVTNQMSKLTDWETKGRNKKFGKYANQGAVDGINFAKENINNYSELLKINDYNWLQEVFNKKY